MAHSIKPTLIFKSSVKRRAALAEVELMLNWTDLIWSKPIYSSVRNVYDWHVCGVCVCVSLKLRFWYNLISLTAIAFEKFELLLLQTVLSYAFCCYVVRVLHFQHRVLNFCFYFCFFNRMIYYLYFFIFLIRYALVSLPLDFFFFAFVVLWINQGHT